MTLFACDGLVKNAQQNIGFDIVELDNQLNEISGLTFDENSNLFAINDEQGIVFQIDPSSGRTIDERYFGKNGDYEGITNTSKGLFVLKSNGDLYPLDIKGKDRFKFPKRNGFDFEGLSYDEQNKQLILACKSHSIKKYKNKVLFYAFDLEKMEYLKKPILTLAHDQVGKNFKPSGLYIQPNGTWFILSSSSRELMIYTMKTADFDKIKLPKRPFQQPEGIVVLKTGEIYISNEKKNGFPNIVKIPRP
jgi:uncharacterized protein YjiK